MWREVTKTRRRWYWILLASALLFVIVRSTMVRSRDGQVPFLSANDRSRWDATVALLDHRSFEIDKVIKRRGWNTIDKVSHYGRDGKQHYYSSKPPILSVLLTIPTAAVQVATQSRLSDRPFLVGRIVLGIVGCSSMAVLWWLAVLSAERWATTDFSRVYVVAAATWGTLLTAYAITINNHLPGAIATFAGFYALLRIWYDRDERPIMYFVAGLGAVCAWACELPALAFLVGTFGALLLCSVRKTLTFALPAVIVVAAAYFGLNYLAHESIWPPYTHRVPGDTWEGSNWYNYPGSYWIPGQAKGVDAGEPHRGVYAFHVLIGHHGILSLTPIWLLSIYGTWLLLKERREYAKVLAIAGLAAVCIVFFVGMRPLQDRNYGGVNCGFRWVLWLTPLWLVAMIPALDRLAQRKAGRWCALALLVASIFSAVWPSMNPWTHPWIYQLWMRS